MRSVLQCPNCSAKVEVQEQYAGMLMKCMVCSQTFTAPSHDDIVNAPPAYAAQQSQAAPVKSQAEIERENLEWRHSPAGAPPSLMPLSPPAPPFSRPAPPASVAPPPPPPPPAPPPPSPPKPPGFDYAKTTKTYQDALEDVGRQRRNLYQHDAGMASAPEVRERFDRGRTELEQNARNGGGRNKEVQRVLSAFDRLAKSAEILAERNDRLGVQEAEQATKQAEQDTKQQQADERARQERAEDERKAKWYKATGKTSAGDALYGADRLEKDPRGYMMSMASLMMSGPVMSKITSLMGNTMSMARQGYAVGGVAGGAAGAAAGAASDIFNLGGNASPQAQSTFDQSFELLKTRLGSTLAADKFMNVASARIQDAGDAVGSNREGGRGFMGRVASHAGDVPWWAGGPGGAPAGIYAGSRAAYGWASGEKAPGDVRPGMEAPPILAGVGSAMGSSASYEQYAQSFGMSSLNASPLDQAKLAEQLKNLTGLLERLTDNSEGLRHITPPFG